MSGEMVTGSAWVQLVPVFNERSGKCTGFRIDRLTQREPPKGSEGALGTLVVGLRMSVPAATFEPLRPRVVIEVPEGGGEPRVDVEILKPEE